MKPLLALLFTGMALLMMGASRPVQAAVASGNISVQSKGGVGGSDTVSWLAEVEYTGAPFSVRMDYQYELVVDYCLSDGTVSTDTQPLSGPYPVHNSGGTPISAFSTFGCNAGPAALAFMNQHPSIVGFSWHYHIKVDAIVNSTGTSASTYEGDSEMQSYGAWVEMSPPKGPPPTDA